MGAFAMIIVLCLICVVVIYIIPLYNNINTMTNIIQSNPHAELTDIPFRTGDLIFFRWNYTIGELDNNYTFTQTTHVDNMNTIVAMSDSYIKHIRFIHPGMIVVYDDIPYILELTARPVYCNYEKKVVSFKPSLTSLTTILEYYGIAGHLPYKGPPISKNTIHSILSEKHKYTHVKYTGSMANNIISYVNSPNLDCDDIDLTGLTQCPEYINCYQYIIIVLKKCKILTDVANKTFLNIMPNDLLDKILNTKKYTGFNIIINNYLSRYYKSLINYKHR